MSRTSRALIAGGAALALLAGSGATFARWYDEKPVAGGDISSGTLSLEPLGAPVWKINTAAEDHNVDPTVPFNPTADKIVPGDVVTVTQQVKLHLEGKNLEATLTFVDAKNSALPAPLTTSTEYVCGDLDLPALAKLTAAHNNKVCDVTTTVTWPIGVDGQTGTGVDEYKPTGDTTLHGDGWDAHGSTNAHMNESGLSLAGGKLLLEQNQRPKP
ncbi:alternate-type signal peptide domain-containing protein [Actinomyces trachealis]|uniref:alternate-type signal peptide domain-containing protein n=1 Tax=Actinomyces trachealis TaxID=2763540 RepID=UPI001892AFD2|nr:alternate-type signal peptide domain-containing protein [Actinomyces trachealis]